ncbi:MAG: amino acid transporter [Frankiales bacterium]|jgi:APA family basic amino acid/polyamine antiporter|nr:amino acid transporter [Frankiales bacterium]
MSVWRTKSVEQSIEDTEEPEHRLRRDLSALDLSVFGIGVIIGTGIFVLTGTAAAKYAGPAVPLSFVLAGLTCALAALCYAEFASTVPVAGSAYTFSYATLGELVAWIIGWDLILEFTLGAAVVAVGWSQYLVSLLDGLGLALPSAVAGPHAVVNLPAAVIVLLLTGVLVAGVKLSSRINVVIVSIKLAVVLFVIVAGLFYVMGANYHPFIPPAQPIEGGAGGWLQAPLVQTLFGLGSSTYGLGGIVTGAAIVFFAFLGFDIVATAAEETKNPRRDVPIGILSSLAVCTALYVAVSLVVTGMQSYRDIDPGSGAPLADAFAHVGRPGFATLISAGALAGLTTVMLILMLGQSRVFFAMARDHLLPAWFAKVHPRFGTPYRITIVTGIVVAVMAAVIPLEALAQLVNIGTLFAFILVSAGVVVLRRTRPDLPRSFRTPFVPWVPALAVLSCLYLMLNLPGETWLRFLAWMVLGVVVYAVYGRRHSRLAGAPPAPGPAPR